MTQPRLIFERLADEHIELFLPKIRYTDRVEIELNGLSPKWSLRHGQQAGPAWAVIKWQEPTPGKFEWPEVIGVGGYSHMGALWSYWKDLSAAESKALLRETPDWLRGIRALAGDMTLRNYVWEGNVAARRWLRLSHCFDIREDQAIDIGGKSCIPFSLLSSEELARV